MSEAKRRRIKQLRALAASTTFPEEAKSARAKADKLDAELPKAEPPAGFGTQDFDLFEAARTMAAMRAHGLNAHNDIIHAMMQQAFDQMLKDGL